MEVDAGFEALTNGPAMPSSHILESGNAREQTFISMRAKMGHLEEVIADLGQFMCDSQLEEHFLSYVLRLGNISKDLGSEMRTVESYLEFMKTHNVSSSSTTGYFSVVPDEVVLYVFSYLSELELCTASLVCKEWNNLTSDDALWRSLYTKYWGVEAVARALNSHSSRPRPLPLAGNSQSSAKQRMNNTHRPKYTAGLVTDELLGNGGKTMSRRNSVARRLSSLWNPQSVVSSGSPGETRTKDRDGSLSSSSSKTTSKTKHGKSKKKAKKKGKTKHKASKGRIELIEADIGSTDGSEGSGINNDTPSYRGRESDLDGEDLYDDGDSGGDDEPIPSPSRQNGPAFRYGPGRRSRQSVYGDDDGCEDDVRWKELFMKYHQTRRNWDTGKHALETLTHHKNTVRCVQFDENYNMISASDDKTIQRLDWDAEKGVYVPKMKLVGHEGGIICMQFDGNRMITGSRDKTLRLWDIEKGQTITTFKNHTGQVWCLQFDEHKIVSGSDDKRLNVWDIGSGKLITSLHGHSWGIGCLQFDDKKIISGAADKTMKIWDMNMMQCRHTLKGHKSSVRCLQFDEQRIVSGSWDNTLKIWDVTTHKCMDTLQGHTNKLMCLQFDDTKIISGAQDKTLRVWDIHTTACMAVLKSHSDSLCDLYFDDTKLVSGSRDKTVKVWDFS
eukprot:TRINITY_DN2059_c1_g1_i4.p1 TRINITY_DN2059_c1_g1~~TRINITY_DN2059_c1_g1_i4.p1  ORF type:complete len:670 (-),score=108.76 TRINITY_DN2059_c1_g1_i4:354-2363(-)